LAFVFILATDDNSQAKWFAAFQFTWIVILFALYRKIERVIPLGGVDNVFVRLLDSFVLLAPVFGVTGFFAFVHYRRLEALVRDEEGDVSFVIPFFLLKCRSCRLGVQMAGCGILRRSGIAAPHLLLLVVHVATILRNVAQVCLLS